MTVFVEGLVGMIVFYFIILIIGVYAGRKTKRTMEDSILASRKFGLFVSSMTLTATWYGGGLINGTAEATATPFLGLVWIIAPWSYGISLAIGGFMFAKAIRDRQYMTFVDALQQRFGRLMGALLLLINLVASFLYIATILLALGSTVSVVLDVGLVPSTIGSVAIVVFYTFFGGLKSVAYTDIVQLPCILIGLVLAIPFAVSHDAVSDIVDNSKRWTGEWHVDSTGVWIDSFIVLTLGAIPVDSFLQRVMSARTTKIALWSCFISSFSVLALSVPPIIIGAIAANTDWSLTAYAHNFVSMNGTNATLPQPQYSMALPMVLQYLTPTWVAVISLGAVSAAVMSSMDSTFIAVGSEVANNLYKPILRSKAGEREIVWVIRATIVITAVISTVIALTAKSIYTLFYLIGDFGGVIMFPQFLCAVYLTDSNTYGSLLGFIVGIVLRIGGGDYLLGIRPFIKYPFYHDIHGQLFPFKTFAMVCTFLVIVGVSYLAKVLFRRGMLPAWMDVFRCFEIGFNLEHKNAEIPMDAKQIGSNPNAEVQHWANLAFQE